MPAKTRSRRSTAAATTAAFVTPFLYHCQHCGAYFVHPVSPAAAPLICNCCFRSQAEATSAAELSQVIQDNLTIGAMGARKRVMTQMLLASCLAPLLEVILRLELTAPGTSPRFFRCDNCDHLSTGYRSEFCGNCHQVGTSQQLALDYLVPEVRDQCFDLRRLSQREFQKFTASTQAILQAIDAVRRPATLSGPGRRA